jgi:beta-lactamase regulating signal transducer with metallopeptidase domain
MDAVLNWLWQGGVVAVALRLMLIPLERASANVRYVVCCTAALLVTALPALPLLQPTPALSDAFHATQGEAIVSLPDAWWTSTLTILAAWTLWASIQVVRFVSAIVAIRRARARSRSFPLHAQSVLPHWRRLRGDGRRATLVLSDSVTTAAVLGWGRPMLAIAPTLVQTLDDDELDRVLIHEWAHVQRRDDLVNILQIVVLILAGWHPALWWIDRRLRIEREMACDEIAVTFTGSPKSYAQCLLKLASLRDVLPAMRTAPAIFTPSSLRARVIKIVSPRSSIAPVWSRSIAAATITVLCLMSVGLGGLNVVEAAVLALPLAPSHMLITTLGRVAPFAVPMGSLDVPTIGSPRITMRRAPSAQRPRVEAPPVSTELTTEPDVPPTKDAPNSDVSALADGRAESTAREQIADVGAIPLERSDVKPQQQQAPWSAATAGGIAVGRKSRDAGVATAGFFIRFARRVAGSF